MHIAITSQGAGHYHRHADIAEKSSCLCSKLPFFRFVRKHALCICVYTHVCIYMHMYICACVSMYVRITIMAQSATM